MLTPNDYHEERLRRLLSRKKKSEIDVILEAVSLILYSTQSNKDIIELFNLLDMDAFVKVVTLFDGRTIKFPTRKYLKNALTLALLYYYKEIKGMDWEEIKKEMPFEVSTISYGIQIKNLNNFIRQKLFEILRHLDNLDADKEKEELAKSIFKNGS